MANFGDFFLRGANSTFPQTFGRTFQFGLDQQEEQRKRNELLKAQQEQQGIMSQIIGGQKVTGASYRGQYAPLDVQTAPMTTEDKFNLYSRLSPTNQNAIEYYNKLTAPKQVKYKEWNGNQYLENPDGSVDWTKPVAEKPDTQTSFEVVKANTIKGYENYPNDYTVQLTKKNNEIVGQSVPHTFKQQKINIETGEKEDKLDPIAKSFLEDKVKELNGLRGLLSHAPDDNGKYKIYDKLGQPVAYYTPDEVRKAIDNKNAELDNYLKSNGGQAMDDYSYYKEHLGGKPESLWGTIYKNYIKDKNDKKDGVWLQTQRFAFIKDYGFDPTMKYDLGKIK